MHRRRAWTLIEAIITIVVATLIGIFIFTILNRPQRGRPAPQWMVNTTRLRLIHQSAIMFAYRNNSYMPGLDASGKLIEPSPRGRFQLLLDGGYCTGELLLNPRDEGAIQWKAGPVSPTSYSFAALEIIAGSRRAEWRDLANSRAPIFSDRVIGADAQGTYRSLWTLNEPAATAAWRGSLVWGDNHAEFIQSHLVETRFGEQTNPLDNLFQSETLSAADAWMVR